MLTARRIDAPTVVNLDSPLSVGLRRWWTPCSQTGFRVDYGTDRVTNVSSGGPQLVGSPRGGVGTYSNSGGAGVLIPATPAMPISNLASCTIRWVFTPLSWPGSFTALFDDADRVWSTFYAPPGNGNFGVDWFGGVNPTLTVGTRWDMVYSHDIAAGTSSSYLNGVLISAAVGVPTGGTLANSLSLGGNPSGGGKSPEHHLRVIPVLEPGLAEW